MIPADIGAELATAIAAAVTAGELPASALARDETTGTWRPAPPGAGGGPGSYATTLPFLLAEGTGLAPAAIAVGLAARLEQVGWIRAASVTGTGYLTIAVTPQALAGLAVRVAQADESGARGTALRGVRRDDASDDGRLARASSWAQAWQLVAEAAAGRLAAAGAEIEIKTDAERQPPPGPVSAASPAAPAHPPGPPGPAASTSSAAPAGPGWPARPATGNNAGTAGPRLGGRTGPAPGPVAAAVAFAGADAIRYALVRKPAGRAGPVDARLSVRRVLDNPYFAVRFAHADAASTLRWAADLGLDRGTPGDLGRPGSASGPSKSCCRPSPGCPNASPARPAAASPTGSRGTWKAWPRPTW